MVRIFLAHAKEDEAAVIHLYKRLKEKGYQPWLDKVDLLPGQNWRAKIPKAIRESEVFIACLSEQSVAKHGYVQREFRMALNECADKPPGAIYLIPVRLDDCTIPELRQEEYGINLRDYQWVDLFADNGFDRLIESLELAFPDGAVATVDVVRASSVRLSDSTVKQAAIDESMSDGTGADRVRRDRTIGTSKTTVDSGEYLDKAGRLRQEISLLEAKLNRCFESRLLTTDPDRAVTLESLEKKLEGDIAVKKEALAKLT